MGGYIMQLQNYSVNDGDGIRTVIFLAGCPLRCAWCANPEGQTLQNPMPAGPRPGKFWPRCAGRRSSTGLPAAE